MPNTKIGSNRWVPDIRPGKIETFFEEGGAEEKGYRIVDAHPIINKILDVGAFFRTHASAVWYKMTDRITVTDALNELYSNVSTNQIGLETATTDISRITEALSSLTTKVNGNSQNITTLQGNIGTINSTLTSHGSSISSLSTNKQDVLSYSKRINVASIGLNNDNIFIYNSQNTSSTNDVCFKITSGGHTRYISIRVDGIYVDNSNKLPY